MGATWQANKSKTQELQALREGLQVNLAEQVAITKTAEEKGRQLEGKVKEIGDRVRNLEGQLKAAEEQSQQVGLRAEPSELKGTPG